jgi:hypothetical protein
MNWFQRHLNYTVVLSWLASELLFVILLAFGAFVLDPFIEPGGIADYLSVALVLILCIALPLLVSGWALRRKKRSLWWLLILFVPFGWIVFLCLENKGEVAWENRIRRGDGIFL